MATRAEIVQSIRQTHKSSYLTTVDVATFMGVMQRDAKRYLENVPYITVGECDKRRKYLDADVAGMIFRRQVRK